MSKDTNSNGFRCSFTHKADTCMNCGAKLPENEDHEMACDDCLREYGDIMGSEEARYYGTPHKLQIWSDEYTMNQGIGEVEIMWANYSNVGYKSKDNPKTQIMKKEDFCHWFGFKRTTY